MAVEAAERYADNPEDLKKCYGEAYLPRWDSGPTADGRLAAELAWSVTLDAEKIERHLLSWFFVSNVHATEQANLLRDIVGNPWHLERASYGWRIKLSDGTVVEFCPPWLRNPDAKQIALEVYESRQWNLLPVLADCLEDAGCWDRAVLTHLRSPGVHVRGSGRWISYLASSMDSNGSDNLSD